MKTLRVFSLFLLLGIPSTALAVPITLDFAGGFGVNGSAVGSLTYDTADAPIGFNVRGLANNATYALTAWNFSITSLWSFMPSTTFASGLDGNSAEFCLGKCVFGSPDVTNLILRNDQNLLMQLTFQMFGPAPFVVPPSDVSQWGSMHSGVYRVPCPICAPVMLLQDGALSASASQSSVPEPSTLWLLTLSLMGLLGWRALKLWRAIS